MLIGSTTHHNFIRLQSVSHTVTPDPFGRAIRDHYLGERETPLIDRDGSESREHSIEQWYFGDHQEGAWRDTWMKGPLVDLGAGAGRDAL